MPPSHPHTLITLTFFWDLPPCDQMRRSSWDPTQRSLYTVAPQGECITHTLQTILFSFFYFLGVSIQQAHTPRPSVFKVGYLAVKQEQLSYVLVMPLLKYCKVPAELSETAWVKDILSQRHCNIKTLRLVTYSLLLVFEVDVHWRGFLAV